MAPSPLFLLGRFLSQFAARLGDFLFPLVIYRQSGSLSLSGLALAIEWLPRIVGLPLCGALADRFRAGRLFAIADLARALLAFVPFLFPDVPVLLATSAAFGFLSALSQVTLERTVATSGKVLARAQMSLEAINNLAFILGSAAAAWLVSCLDLRALFVVLAALFACPAPCLWRAGLAHPAAPRSPFSPARDASAALSILKHKTRLRQIVICGFLLAIASGIVTSTGPAMITTEFALPGAAFAQVQMWAAAATVLAVLLSRHVPGAAARTQWIGLATIAAGLFLAASAWSFPLWVLGYAIFFAGIMLFSIHLRCERVAHIPPKHLGKTLGIIMVLTAAGLPVGGLLVAYLADTLPVRGVTWLAWPAFAGALFLSLFIRSSNKPRTVMDSNGQAGSNVNEI
ncbi:MFS transporter [Trinickia fusca]|uniref:MFS transporter n=1 Tax=Trinickia fusca TaxID=2419777 RepID=UPI0015FF8A40|nr:MFS transporter [Trinickia fusca]